VTPSTRDVTVIVPARNAEQWIRPCLQAVARSHPAETIVVDGLSADRTVKLARAEGARVISDEGQGVAAARRLGAEAARTPYVALIDVDVVLPQGALQSLLEEFIGDGYTGLQAGLRSVSGPRYWGRALTAHHRSGRSKKWFGAVATVFEREALLEHGFDDRFMSGEDIDLRWRLQRAGAKVGVSHQTVVEHHFGDTWQFAKGQWLADGHGLARMVRVRGPRSLLLPLLPLAAAVRGAGLSLVRLQPQWLPYYACFCVFNYAGMAAELGRTIWRSDAPHGDRPHGARALSMFPNSLALIGSKLSMMGLGFLFWLLAARLFAAPEVGLAAGVVAAIMLCTQIALFGIGSSVIALLPRELRRPRALLDSAFTLVAGFAVSTSLVFLLLAVGLLGNLRVVPQSPAYALMFVVATVTGTIGILMDQLSTSLRRGDQALVRGIAFGTSTLLALLVMSRLGHGWGSKALLFPWVVAGTVACAIGLRQFHRPLRGYLPRPAIDRRRSRRLLATGLPNYALTLSERAPGLLLPVIVTELLSPTANAAWYAAWMMAWVVFIVPIQVGMTLFAEIAHDPDSLPAATQRAVKSALVVGIPVALVLGALAHPLLSLLGGLYADQGVWPLRILLVGLVPLTFVQAYYASCRGVGRLGEAIAAGWAAGALSVVAAAAAGVAAGLEAMALVWLGVQLGAAAFAGCRLRALRRRHAVVQRTEPAPIEAQTALATSRVGG
jgi:O-antigen/teichoic acid export membrane protein